MDNFLCSDIKVVEGWDAILSRPAIYLGKKSIFGLSCLIVGVTMANESVGFKKNEDGSYKAFDQTVLGVNMYDFEDWVRAKFKYQHNSYKSYELALKQANNNDEKAFDIWAEWLKEFKNLK